ncbi:MAG: VanW family protein [Candidatus Omnitrophica bacterium]|nr:VanW family protein [Candidatus Omnitrophota bacterium]
MNRIRGRGWVFLMVWLVWFPLAGAAAEIQLPCLLGSCSSPLAGSTPERIQNIRAAVEKISGRVLQPGESFSYNQTVGPRTRATGFLPAPAIVHEALRPVIGGGICQVSSTLFNAVLLSDLTILERHRHYTPVNYLPLGMDATISWGTKDFRFKNNSPGSIQIIGRVSDSTLTFQIYGEQPLPEELRLETEIVESPSPHPEEESEPAIEIKLYRVRLKEGKTIARQLIHTDFYPARIIQPPRES